uniref:Uncharacterized protein n=1 Tax=Parascaris equorum TaxID=6256 RepID=A0A914S6G4_PAREQ
MMLPPGGIIPAYAPPPHIAQRVYQQSGSVSETQLMWGGNFVADPWRYLPIHGGI